MSIDHPSGREHFAGDFRLLVNKGIEKALAMIQNKFENQTNKKENLPFHDTKHTKKVVENVEKILGEIRSVDQGLVSVRDMEIGRLAAAYHDVVQNWVEKKVKDGDNEKVMRDRTMMEVVDEKGEKKLVDAKNEAASALKAEEFMREANANGQAFSEEDIAKLKSAIDMTVAGWEVKSGTVVQTNLSDKRSPVERALALSDLATAGMGESGEFVDEGRRIFREDNLDIFEAIHSGEEIPGDRQKYFKTRMLNFLRSQPGFARGRQARLSDELKGLPKSAEEAVSQLFNKFDNSIMEAEEVVKKYDTEKVTFDGLVEYFEYKKEM